VRRSLRRPPLPLESLQQRKHHQRRNQKASVFDESLSLVVFPVVSAVLRARCDSSRKLAEQKPSDDTPGVDIVAGQRHPQRSEEASSEGVA
jgi:hypothetical protein